LRDVPERETDRQLLAETDMAAIRNSMIVARWTHLAAHSTRTPSRFRPAHSAMAISSKLRDDIRLYKYLYAM